MKVRYLLILNFIILTSCSKKEELYEVEIPDSVYVNEQETKDSINNVIAKDGTFKMKGLNFNYNEIESFLDARTIETHYGKIHLNYLEKLNEIIKGTPLEKLSIEEILSSLEQENNNLIYNSGGYFNHNLYWDIITKEKNKKLGGKINDLINRDFGSFENFKSQFKKTAENLQGSGWVWLILTEQDNLKIVSTTNNNNPLMSFETDKGYPLMNLDMWEHAYFIKYKNNKSEYIDNYFKSIDWDKVNYRIDLKQ